MSKTRRITAIMLGLSLLLSFQPIPIAAVVVQPLVASTLNELKAALENPAGGHVTLGANITVLSSLKQTDALINVPAGSTHVLNLNGFTYTYLYLNQSNEYDGVPIRVNGNLTINGPGAITGGYVAVENAGWDTTLILNGGSFTGKDASAIRSGGLTVINGGTLTGRFGDVWHERGLLVDNAGIVKKIDRTFAQNTSSILNGILSGKAELSGHLVINNLQIPETAFMTIMNNGILEVAGTLTGEERLKIDGGLFIRDGAATIDKQFQMRTSLDLGTLTVTASGEVNLATGTRVTIRDTLTNNGILRVANGAFLSVGGNLVNNGHIQHEAADGVTVKGDISGTGTLTPSGGPATEPAGPLSDDQAPEHMMNAANTLYLLALFKGTGTHPNGDPVYDLMAMPTRQVAITMLIRLLGKEQLALTGNWTHPFTDVDAWATPYVGYAYANGLTSGVSDTLFGGTDLTTPTQYLTFLLRALGYRDAEGDFAWDKPNLLAKQLGMDASAYFEGIVPFIRGDVAYLSEMALHQQMKNSQQRLVDALVESGAVSREAAEKAGFIPATP